jgi:hypothetical protein
VLHDRETQQIQADDVVAQFRAKIGGDGLCDLGSRQVNGTSSERLSRQRGHRDWPRLSPIEERPNLAVAPHTIRKTHPASAFLGLKIGPTSGKIPEGWTSSQGVESDKCSRFSSVNRSSR